MSFILDALKKSESDRQRQGGPALFEVKVAPPRSGLPAWAVAIAVLFVANLALVGWLLVRRALPAAMGQPLRPVAAASAPASPPRAFSATPQGAAGAAPSVAPDAAPSAAPALAPPPAVAAARPSPAAPDLSAAPSPAPANSDDFAPAAEPAPTGNLGRVKRNTEAGVPLYQQLAATPNNQVPQLHLDLHAYAEKAEDRWVLINMHKLREGDTLEGVHVERITPEGAVLSYQGSQFLLTQE